jgi:hypothetical protein
LHLPQGTVNPHWAAIGVNMCLGVPLPVRQNPVPRVPSRQLYDAPHNCGFLKSSSNQSSSRARLYHTLPTFSWDEPLPMSFAHCSPAHVRLNSVLWSCWLSSRNIRIYLVLSSFSMMPSQMPLKSGFSTSLLQS